MVKDPTFCQSASCPRSDEGFFPSEMIKEFDLLFCSPSCLNEFKQLNRIEDNGELKSMKYLGQEKLNTKRIKKRHRPKPESVGEHYIPDDENYQFSLRQVHAYRLFLQGWHIAQAMRAVGYSEESVDKRAQWFLESKSFKFLKKVGGVI